MTIFRVCLAPFTRCALFVLFSLASAMSANAKEQPLLHAELAREVASEGIILLENDGVLPFRHNQRLAVFGIAQQDYLHVGTGSGYVNAPYTVNLIDGLENQPGITLYQRLTDRYKNYYEKTRAELRKKIKPGGPPGSDAVRVPEMPLSESLLTQAVKANDAAVIVLNRPSGEGKDRTMDGDYLLNPQEETLFSQVLAHFDKVVVVLNIAGIIDMSWVDRFKPSAVLIAWLPGMEGGNALADILTGNVNPSGKLTSSIAFNYKDYPSSANFGGFVDGYEKRVADGTEIEYWGFIPNHKTPAKGVEYERPVNNRYFVEYEEDIYVGYRYFETFGVPVRYPFGFGLSYTQFDITVGSVENRASESIFTVKVTNRGKVAGKEVVQIYVNKPDGNLEQPEKVLAAFAKTNLLEPDESQTLTITVAMNDLASFDTSASAYVLEPGRYSFFAGNSVKHAPLVSVNHLNTRRVVKQVSKEMPVLVKDFHVLSKFAPVETKPETPPLHAKDAGSPPPGPGGEATIDLSGETTEQAEISFADVSRNTALLKQYIAQFSDTELIALLVGPGMGSEKSLFGLFSKVVGGAAGQTATIKRLGLPSIALADGPAGLRLEAKTTGFPVGTLVASTWNVPLAEQMGVAVGQEAQLHKVDLWLAPSLNIHRNPLNGRNFEYYSEDPLISGKMAAAVTRGVQSQQVGVTLKHLVANNQEAHRFDGIDTVVSERALRDIYLKGFEIALSASNPRAIMTAYNAVNGTYTAASEDLISHILRGEWGYDGVVMTDWEGDGIYSYEALLAGNNLFMPGFPGQIQYFVDGLKSGKISREDLEAAALPLVRLILSSPQ